MHYYSAVKKNHIYRKIDSNWKNCIVRGTQAQKDKYHVLLMYILDSNTLFY